MDTPPFQFRIIVNCGPCEEYIAKCLRSIRAQSDVDWRAYVTVDACEDGTFEAAITAVEADTRFLIRRNRTRRYAMRNLIEGIDQSCAAEQDVIVVLDGDDWFATHDALRIIRRAYRQEDCWMTYGSWVPNRLGMRGLWPAYPEGTSDFRNCEWRATAVRTWKKWLWDRIDDRDFRDAEGNYFRVTEDQAAMLPMLEMSGTERARHIPDILMVYNRISPHAVCYTRRDEMLANAEFVRRKPPYRRLEMRVCV